MTNTETAEYLEMLRQPRITGKRLTLDLALVQRGVAFAVLGDETTDDGTPLRQVVLPAGADVFCLEDDSPDESLYLAFVFADGTCLPAVERWVASDGLCGHHEVVVLPKQALAVNALHVLTDVLDAITSAEAEWRDLFGQRS
jgi:hypothetical protein